MAKESGGGGAESKAADTKVATRQRRFFYADDKVKIILEALGSSKPTEVMRQYGLHANVFYRWRQEFIAGGTRALHGESAESGAAEEIRSMAIEIGKLKMELGEMYMKMREAERALLQGPAEAVEIGSGGELEEEE